MTSSKRPSTLLVSRTFLELREDSERLAEAREACQSRSSSVPARWRDQTASGLPISHDYFLCDSTMDHALSGCPLSPGRSSPSHSPELRALTTSESFELEPLQGERWNSGTQILRSSSRVSESQGSFDQVKNVILEGLNQTLSQSLFQKLAFGESEVSSIKNHTVDRSESGGFSGQETPGGWHSGNATPGGWQSGKVTPGFKTARTSLVGDEVLVRSASTCESGGKLARETIGAGLVFETEQNLVFTQPAQQSNAIRPSLTISLDGNLLQAGSKDNSRDTATHVKDTDSVINNLSGNQNQATYTEPNPWSQQANAQRMYGVVGDFGNPYQHYEPWWTPPWHPDNSTGYGDYIPEFSHDQMSMGYPHGGGMQYTEMESASSSWSREAFQRSMLHQNGSFGTTLYPQQQHFDRMMGDQKRNNKQKAKSKSSGKPEKPGPLIEEHVASGEDDKVVELTPAEVKRKARRLERRRAKAAQRKLEASAVRLLEEAEEEMES